MPNRKSNLNIGAGIIFLIAALNLICVIISTLTIGSRFGFFDKDDTFGIVLIVLIALSYLVISIALFGRNRSHVLTGMFAFLAVLYLTKLIKTISDYSKLSRYIKIPVTAYLPDVFSLLACIFAVIVCASSVSKAEGEPVRGGSLLWPIPALLSFASGLVFIIDGAEALKNIFEGLKYIFRVEDGGIVFFYLSAVIYIIMLVVIPFGFLLACRWIAAPVKASAPYVAPQYGAQYGVQQPPQPRQFNPQPQQFNPQPQQFNPQPQQFNPQPQPEANKIPTGYDPATGQYIYSDPAPAPEAPKEIVGYDPMTGQPIYKN